MTLFNRTESVENVLQMDCISDTEVIDLFVVKQAMEIQQAIFKGSFYKRDIITHPKYRESEVLRITTNGNSMRLDIFVESE